MICYTCHRQIDPETETFGADYHSLGGPDYECDNCQRRNRNASHQSPVPHEHQAEPVDPDGIPRIDWREGTPWMKWLMHENANDGTPGGHGSSGKTKRFGGQKQGTKIEREAWGA